MSQRVTFRMTVHNGDTPRAFEPSPGAPSEPLHFPEQQVAVKTHILQELINEVFCFRRGCTNAA